MKPASAFPLRTALKIAWREARASSARFAFVVLAVALGVGALTGVRGFSKAFREMLLKEARTLMAADLTVRIFGSPAAAQQQAMDALASRGVERTQVTETLSMVTSAGVPDPMLVAIKAVDPALYPFYGELALEPAGPLRERLHDGSALLSPELLDRLRVQPGGAISIGGQEFRVSGTIIAEPDRMSGSMNVGPRVMITRRGLERTGLVGLTSRAAQRYLFRLTPGSPDIAAVRKELAAALPEARIIDYRETNPQITSGLERATTFLSLITLIALIVGALGVGTAMHAHLQQKLDSIAIMKSLGARSSQVMRIYLMQTLLLGVLGAALGVLAGLLVQAAFPVLIVRYFQIRPDVSFDLLTAAQGLIAGVLVTLLFTVPPLVGIRRIKPNVIFRRDMPEQRTAWRERLRASRPTAVSGLLIVAGVFGLSLWLIGSDTRMAFRVALWFVAGLVVSLLMLAAVAALLIRALRSLTSRWKMPPTVRHGIANVYRPGSHSAAILTALGVGVMFTLTVYLMQRSVLRQMAQDTPPDMPNVFLLDITPQQRPAVLAMLDRYGVPGRQAELISTVTARLVSFDGKPVDPRFTRSRAITIHPSVPVKGGPAISVSERTARYMGLKLGSVVEWNAFGRVVRTTVTRIHEPQMHRISGMVEFQMSPGSLEGLPTVLYGAARVDPKRVPELQRVSYGQFPTITVVNMADAMARIEEVIDQIALVIRFLSAFAILAGATILASSVAGTRFRRLREVVILKTLGATRARIVRVFSTEFLILGLVAGTMGALLATAFSMLIVRQLLDAPYHFEPLPPAVAVVATALIATGTGWLASFRILGQKPLEVLRNE